MTFSFFPLDFLHRRVVRKLLVESIVIVVLRAHKLILIFVESLRSSVLRDIFGDRL